MELTKADKMIIKAMKDIAAYNDTDECYSSASHIREWLADEYKFEVSTKTISRCFRKIFKYNIFERQGKRMHSTGNWTWIWKMSSEGKKEGRNERTKQLLREATGLIVNNQWVWKEVDNE